MTGQPLVTAVMIFLNGENYIAESIESILAQTYTNWELVLVDDGSTDGATEIAKDYAVRYPERIRYIEHENHENHGMSASRNAGVAAGYGEYISFLDADDIWLPTRLTHFVEIAEAFPDAGMVFGPTLYWYSWAAERGMEPPVPGQEDFEGHVDFVADELIPAPVPLQRFLATRGGCIPGICSLLIRRTAYDDIGGFEPAFRGLYEDQVFLSKITLHHPTVVTHEVLDYYRQHSESCCYRAIESGEYHPQELHPARGNYLLWLQQYCARVGISDPTIDRIVRKQLIPHRFPILVTIHNAAVRALRIPQKVARRVLPKNVQNWIGACKRKYYALRYS
jgi:glycosyltransferase involved in cell wall biosynthesis